VLLEILKKTNMFQSHKTGSIRQRLPLDWQLWDKQLCTL